MDRINGIEQDISHLVRPVVNPVWIPFRLPNLCASAPRRESSSPGHRLPDTPVKWTARDNNVLDRFCLGLYFRALPTPELPGIVGHRLGPRPKLEAGTACGRAWDHAELSLPLPGPRAAASRPLTRGSRAAGRRRQAGSS